MDVGQVIAGRFKVTRLIRRSGMGDVYEGIDQQTGEKVAIKQLKLDTLGEISDSIHRFRREGETLRALDHPNIVKIISALEEDGENYIVMEFVPGGSLADLLRHEGKLPIRRTIHIALDLADALTRAHRLGIVHRDIKPDNVLLAADGSPRLSDFGLAHVGDSTITRSGVMVGTYLYLSPEAFNGKVLDARADIWAFGVMMYQMISGRHPFTGETPAAIMTSVLSQPPPDLERLRPDAPVSLVDLVYRMLDKNIRQRVQSMRQVGAELEVMVRQLDAPETETPLFGSARSAFAPTPSTAHPSMTIGNLPPPATPFVGREMEVSNLLDLINYPSNRLITIAGPGGMGKTRLALHLAERAQPQFPDGAFFVALAPVTEPDRIIPTIADALNFTFYQAESPKAQLISYLHEKCLLLVLDNFEHLMGGADLITEILNGAPHVKLLVTSRERLNVQGESLLVVEGMPYPIQLKVISPLATSDDEATQSPIQDFAAIRLFVQCIKQQRTDAVIDESDLTHVVRICQLVQGMPLGIELAAAWYSTLPLADIVREIESNLDFLESTARDLPARQRSIRAVFEYTWNLLSQADQDVFKRLAVFRGGFTREAAQQIAEASLRTLANLIDKSLLRRAPDGRYEIHELLRQYAETRLHEDDAVWETVRNRHSAHYLKFLAARSERLKNKEQVAALGEVEVELDNVRMAWLHAAMCKDYEALAPALEPFWNFHIDRDRLQEGELIFDQATEGLRGITTEGKAGLTLAFALILHAVLAHRSGQEEKSQRNFQEGTALLDRLNARREATIARLWNTNGTADEVAERLKVVIVTFRELGDRWSLAAAHLSLGLHYDFHGPITEAKVHLLESLTTARSLGDPLGQAGALSCLGWHCFQTGEYDEGHKYFEEGRTLYLKTGTPGGVASVLRGMGTIDWMRGHYPDAEKFLTESLMIYRKMGSLWGVAPVLSSLGIVAWRRGTPEQAIEPMEESIAIYRELGVARSLSNGLVNLGHPLLELGRDEQALRTFREAMATAHSSGALMQVLEALAGIGAVYGYAAREKEAIQLLTFVQDYPSVSAEVKEIAERYMAELDWQVRIKFKPDEVAEQIEQGRSLTMEQAIDLSNFYPLPSAVV